MCFFEYKGLTRKINEFSLYDGTSWSEALLSALRSASSLAIVGIWKSYTELGPWGIAAAIALTGVVAAATGVQIATIKAQKMAEGGIVPPGYPKDTYPALLTSGEEVLPARKSKDDMMGGEVVFKIHQDELWGVLKKKESVNANF